MTHSAIIHSRPPRRLLAARIVLAACLFFPTLVVTIPACTADEDKNWEERAAAANDQLDPGCIDECRWVLAGQPEPDPVDCEAAEEGLEFYPLAIWDFDSDLAVASNMYSYSDWTTDFQDPNGWEPPTLVANRCIGHGGTNRALHLRGGPFVEWGGGIGRDLKCLNNAPFAGSIKFDQLGIADDERESYSRVYRTEPFAGVCDADSDCLPGWECSDSGLCAAPDCETDADCEAAAGWLCRPDTHKCARYVWDWACGEPPRWTLPGVVDPFSGENEAACRNGTTRAELEGQGLSEAQIEEYMAYREVIESACPERDQEATRDGPETAGDEEFILGATLDVSEWEGISFWARRTIDSQAGIRIAMGDKYTDDDLKYLQDHVNPDAEPYCKRNVACNLSYRDHSRCHDGRLCVRARYTDTGDEESNPQECGSGALVDGRCAEARVCFDPERDLPPPNWSCEEVDGEWVCNQNSSDDTLARPWHGPCVDDLDDCPPPPENGLAYPCVLASECPEESPCNTYAFPDPEDPEDKGERYCWNPLRDFVPYTQTPVFQPCGEFACRQFYKPFQRHDATVYGKGCNFYDSAGSITRAYCYDPGEDPDPAEGLDLCGDHWLKAVYLSTEWQFYTIPFKSLLQQGWAQESHRFDLTSAAVVRFTWDRGWIDYWIDDVRFYRHKRE